MQNNFDTHAKTYDTVFTYSQIGKAQRDRVYHFLKKHTFTNKKLNILELNCGTGEDAYYLSKLGHTVLATDISSEMICIAKSKYQNSKLQFQELDITKIHTESFSEKFDLIFSNFGGLNCLSEIEIKHFIKTTPSLLSVKGKLALVLMPKNCIWERFYFLSKGQIKKAYRRKTNKAILANVDGIQVPTWYYNPREVKTYASNFNTLQINPVGIAIPPSYLESFFTTKKWFFKFLIWKEKILCNSFWAKYADHFLIVFQKK